MKQRTMSFAAGVMTGAVLFGGGVAYAAGVMAEYAPQRAYVDGSPVQIEAYNIGGYNYVKLRDIGEAVNFNVYWDGKAIQIDSGAPYTGLSPIQPTQPNNGNMDYAKEATTAAFTNELNREVYNAIRDTVLHRNEIVAGTYTPVMVDDAGDRYNLMQGIVSKLGNYPSYNVTSPEMGKLAVRAQCTSYYDAAVAHTQPFINNLAGLSQREQVKSLVRYICARMSYSTAIVAPSDILASDGVTSGNCMSYAHSLLFLCNRANIPCILVHSDDHQWNMVYVDGQWWDVDVSAIDDPNPQMIEKSSMLKPLNGRTGSLYADSDPVFTRFAQELLIPGSTK